MNNKMYRIGFFILLVINIGLVVMFVMRPRPPIGQVGIKEEISRELNFTETQKATFDEMAKAHRESMRELDRHEHQLMKSFFGQLSSDRAGDNNDSLLQEIIQLEKEKITVTYTHFEELKALCDEDQRTRFDQVINKIIPVLTNAPEKTMNPGKPRR
ncbi:MAG: hypothetical protein RLO17_04530 [Cyclobacteriaceae bacterium]